MVSTSLLLVSVFVAISVCLVTIYHSLCIVDTGEIEALLVFGEIRTILPPGVHFVPPFVSDTYPVDPTTKVIDMGDRKKQVPDELEDDLREATRSDLRN